MILYNKYMKNIRILSKDSIMYHITPSKNLNKILKRGLNTSFNVDSGFDNVPRRALYLGNTPNHAIISSGHLCGESFIFCQDEALLSVRLKKGTKMWKDPEPGNGWILNSSVSSDSIKLVKIIPEGIHKISIVHSSLIK